MTLKNEYVSFQILSNDDKAATLSSIGTIGLSLDVSDRSEYNFQPRVNRDNKHTLALPSGIEGQLYSFASLVTTIRATEIGRAGNGSVWRISLSRGAISSGFRGEAAGDSHGALVPNPQHKHACSGVARYRRDEAYLRYL